MSDSFKRRRRRSGSSAPRYTPAEVVRAGRRRRSIGRLEIAGAIGTFVVAIALIVLIWMVAERAIDDERADIRDLAQRTLAGQAGIMAENISHELLMIDQSLKVLEEAWKTDSDHFDLSKWETNMPALMAVADDLLIADDKHIIRQDILPQAAGQGVASAYISWPHGSLERLRGDTGTSAKSEFQLGLPDRNDQPVDSRRFLMYIVRPLDYPPGWLIGASFKTDELPRLYAQSWLGINTLAALIDMKNAGVQTVIGPAARRPQRGLAKTELYEAISRSDSGIWDGVSAIDGVEHIHAFHRIPGRDMIVVVASTVSEAMAPLETLIAGIRTVAVAASGVVLALAALLGWSLYRLRADRRRQRAVERDQAELDRLRADEAATIARSELQTARLRALVEHGSDGIALLDSDLKILGWNRRFERGVGVPLQENAPLDAVLRQQAALGMFGSAADAEAEVARRVAFLRTGEAALPQPGPGQVELMLRGLRIDVGGVILLLSGLPPAQPAPAAGSELRGTAGALVQAEEGETEAIEW